MHPVIEEILRAKAPDQIRHNVLRRWQQQLRDEVQPLLDRLAAFDVAALAQKQAQASGQRPQR